MMLQIPILLFCVASTFAGNALMPLSAADKQAAVDTHNKFRKELGIAGYPLVSWDDHVAEQAQRGAITCRKDHQDNRDYGENIYVRYSLDNTAATMLTDAANRWGSEEQYVDYPFWKCSVSFKFPEIEDTCGHYSAMIWNTTVRIGCAVATCPESTYKNGQYVFCAYDEKGNKALRVGYDANGDRIYEPRKPFPGPYNLA